MTRETGLDPIPAALIVAGVLTISGIVSRPYSPDPSHPRLRRWYKALDKPPETPPDVAFGIMWPILLTSLGVGAWRLLRREPSPARNGGLALAALTVGLVDTYAKITFGDRDLTAGTSESRALVGVAASYVIVAAVVDRPAAALGVPLALWSGFGSWLTDELKLRNPRLDSGAVTGVSAA